MNKKKFAVSAYIENDAHILLIDHVKQKEWVPVGGHIETYESPIDAVSREVEEETGLVLGKDVELEASLTSFQANMYDMPDLLAYEEHDVNPPGTVHLCFSFLLHATHRNIVPCHEYTNIKWISMPEVKEFQRVPKNVRRLLLAGFGHIHRQ